MQIVTQAQVIKEMGTDFDGMISYDYYVKEIDGSDTLYHPIKDKHLQMIAKSKPTI